MSFALITVEIRFEHDVVLARQRARQLAAAIGFDEQDQVRIATAVSELCRNVFQYVGSGRAEFKVIPGDPQEFEIVVTDRGPGIPHLERILSGRYVSSTGMGVGLLGAKRLMDRFEVIAPTGEGTRVTIAKHLPMAKVISPKDAVKIADELMRQTAQNPFQEIQRQNQELMRALDELQRRSDELARLNRELEDTNRGVVALYAELDERADSLRRVSELKSHFLSNMTHEFRTPLNSILSLSRMLMDRVDGDLSEGQEQQVKFIRSSANDLSELVNDLLDLAKMEAGKMSVRPAEFHVSALFGALRGVLRPLLQFSTRLTLTFDDPVDIPPLYSDESKVAQVLRNFISNAIKYTPAGEVRVSVRRESEDVVIFEVTDTGIGIAPEDHERVFQEFVQIENQHQRKIKGTGLGLPLSRRLAELLGGGVTLKSELGKGSTFAFRVPVVYLGDDTQASGKTSIPALDPAKRTVLVVDDNVETQFIYERYLQNTLYQPVAVHSLKEARDFVAKVRPHAIVLDVLLNTESSWGFLAQLKQSPDTRHIPVLVVTVINNEQKARELGAEGFAVKPIDRAWLLGQLNHVIQAETKVLLIDDDPASRYVLKDLLTAMPLQLLEAENGSQGLQSAVEHHPHAIFLDLAMPGMSGFEVLQLLKTNPVTQAIPVIIHTSKELTPLEEARLLEQAHAVLSKDHEDRAASVRRVHEVLSSALPARMLEVPHV